MVGSSGCSDWVHQVHHSGGDHADPRFCNPSAIDLPPEPSSEVGSPPPKRW